MLSSNAEKILQQMGYNNISFKGDGTLGWPEKAPFDSIRVAQPQKCPVPFGTTLYWGRLVIPIGDRLVGTVLFSKDARVCRVTPLRMQVRSTD